MVIIPRNLEDDFTPAPSGDEKSCSGFGFPDNGKEIQVSCTALSRLRPVKIFTLKGMSE